MRSFFSFFFSSLTLFLPLLCSEPELCLAKKLEQAAAGDFIVTEHAGYYSLLLLRSINAKRAIFEEISAPQQALHLEHINWRDWTKQGAPGHTSWLTFELDLQQGKLLENYSWTKQGWLHLQPEEHFLSQLLTLPAQRLSSQERKRIGPAPPPGEPDRRKIWNPPLFFEGQKGRGPTEAWRIFWPQDKSPFAGSRLDLYFNPALANFPFPLWLEIYGGHYTAKIRTIEAGRKLTSPAGPLPRRAANFLGAMEKKEGKFLLRLRCPLYYEKFQLYATKASKSLEPGIALPFTAERKEDNEQLWLWFEHKTLAQSLKPEESYYFAFLPEEDPTGSCSSSEPFTWTTLPALKEGVNGPEGS